MPAATLRRSALLPLAATLAFAAVRSASAQTPAIATPAGSAAPAVASATEAAPSTNPPSPAPNQQATIAGTVGPPPLAGPISPADRKAALHAYDRGIAAMRGKHYDEAAAAFARAIQQDPTRPAYYQALSVAREARVTGLLHEAAQERSSNPSGADRLLAQARGVDPGNPRVLQRDPASSPARANGSKAGSALEQLHFVPAGAIVAEPNLAVHSFHQSSDTRAFAAVLGSVYGLRVTVDPDLQNKQFRMDLDDADFATAMAAFSMVAEVFATPLDPHSILIATDSPDNRKRLEHMLEETVPLPGYSNEQINEIGTMLRTVFDLPDQKQVQNSPLLNALVIRAPEDTLHAMDAVLADLVDSGSEVTVDMKLYSVDSSKVRNLGITLPTSFTLFSVRSQVQQVLNSNSSLIQQLIANGVLAANTSPAAIAAYLIFVAGLGSGTSLQNTFFIFGGGLNSLTTNGTSSGIGVTPLGIAANSFPALNFALQTSQAVSLDDLQLRGSDRQTVVFKAGTRYPIQTSIYSSIASSSTSNGSLASLLAQYLGSSAASALNSATSIPQFQYQDLGMTVNATPRVMNQQEVALKLEVKISALSGNSLNGIPILASRELSSTLSLHDGETVVMASHVTDSEAKSVNGVPGLSSIPGLKNLTNRVDNDAHTTLVLLVTPHIVRHSHDVLRGPYIPLQSRPDND